MLESNLFLNDDLDKFLVCSFLFIMVMFLILGLYGIILLIDGKDIYLVSQVVFYVEFNVYLLMFFILEKRYKLFYNDEGLKDFSMFYNRDSKLEFDGESMFDKEDRQKMVFLIQRVSRRKNNIFIRYKQLIENYLDDNFDEKDLSKECIDDGRYYYRRSKIVDSIENERFFSFQFQRYYFNFFLVEGDVLDKKEDDESFLRRDFFKIVFFLFKFFGYDF